MSNMKKNILQPVQALMDNNSKDWKESNNNSNDNVINGIKTNNEIDAAHPTVVMANRGNTGELTEISFVNSKVAGSGSFGVVFRAKLIKSNEVVAIKKVLQDKRFKNRELQIMNLVSHPNVVTLKYYFYSNGEKKDEVFLNLVLEFIPETIYRASRHYVKIRQNMPILSIKLYMYQLFRSLAYIHSLGICHRDIKPQNLLLDPSTGVLKLCDFGSAKILIAGEPNVSYICSRYYRAPELIFGSINYSVLIDIWSAGCVMAELMLGQPLFLGESCVDQLVEIIKILGTPTKEQILSMNEHYSEYKFPQIKSCSWSKVFRGRVTTPEALELLSGLLEYTPTKRLTAIEAMTHPFFNELRQQNTVLLSGKPLPPLFNFTKHELSINPSLNRKLVPDYALSQLPVDLDNFIPLTLKTPQEMVAKMAQFS